MPRMLVGKREPGKVDAERFRVPAKLDPVHRFYVNKVEHCCFEADGHRRAGKVEQVLSEGFDIYDHCGAPC